MLGVPRAKFFAAGSVIALAVAYLMVTGMSSSTVYYLTVAELRDKGNQAYGEMVRVNGKVEPGSIVREMGGLELRFVMLDESGALPVVYRGGTIPDIFDEHVDVVVEGKLDQQGELVATTLLAKCPSRFESGEPLALSHQLSAPAGASG